jgi:hypothetical protein
MAVVEDLFLQDYQSHLMPELAVLVLKKNQRCCYKILKPYRRLIDTFTIVENTDQKLVFSFIDHTAPTRKLSIQ